MKLRLTLYCIAALLLFESRATAESFRCKGGIVSTGDSRADLIKKCGQPDDSEDVDEDRGFTWQDGEAQPVTVTIQKLYYNCGADSLTRIITIDGDRVKKIETGDYGTGPNRCE